MKTPYDHRYATGFQAGFYVNISRSQSGHDHSCSHNYSGSNSRIHNHIRKDDVYCQKVDYFKRY